MGSVVPFLPRAAHGATRGDWSPAERARLADFTRHLATHGAQAVAYGVADDGDPWCAITDHRGEVLVHVARIDGRYLIHDAASDGVKRADSLPRAFEGLPDRFSRRVTALHPPLAAASPAQARAPAVLGSASAVT